MIRFATPLYCITLYPYQEACVQTPAASAKKLKDGHAKMESQQAKQIKRRSKNKFEKPADLQRSCKGQYIKMDS